MAGRTVAIELGGKTRNLRFDLNALAAVGEKLDIEVRIDHFAEDLMSKPLEFSMLRVLLWATLLHEDKDLTPEEVGAWVGPDNMGEVSNAFFSLFNGTSSARRMMTDLMTPDQTTPEAGEGTSSISSESDSDRSPSIPTRSGDLP